MKKMLFLSAVISLFFANAAYSQDCIKGDCKNGTGSMTWKTGDKYDGQFKAGNMNGKGTLTYKNGVLYKGDFVNGKITKGAMSWPNGDKYDGAFHNNTMNGIGTLTYANGTIFKGMWADGKIGKTGMMTWTTGDKYDGAYKDGKRDGIGTMIWKSGDKYTGQWKNDQMDGDGILTYANKKVVKGKWKNGQPVAQAHAGQASPEPKGKYGMFCLLNPGDTRYVENPSIVFVFEAGGKGTFTMINSESQFTGKITWALEKNVLTLILVGMEDGPQKYIYDSAKKYYAQKPEPYGPNQEVVSRCIIKKMP
jgi:hypothetical protein